jgi:hypothetical protein
MIIHHLGIGAAMIGLSVAIQASFMLAAITWLKAHPPRIETMTHKTIVIVGLVLWLFLAMCVQCWLWAGMFLVFGALGSLEEALYFSTVTFTTLGYGDVVLGPDWRLLGSFAAANGTIIIGWTTALVFLAVQRIFGVGPKR